ncbi:DNA replication initiation control protein YabA [Macrococcus sp. DPC7161]|uniref:DNA replication initiation control protein YabA n=1 Tax=Macrococcus sp. DPC7161 TaxID=2507060 RepID=UPI00100B7E05|nr:DNA replication initiation control protein YabA [Macrococcus sp. DPC7161]RXK17186.1 DNA replication initiation control protein YabA [Macrococcus sp. DPC7161]
MNRDELLNTIVLLETQMNTLNKDFERLKKMTVELVEENVALTIERDHLQRVIQTQTKEEKKMKPLQSKENLAMLYREGFHICAGELFGKHREGSDCMFCLNILDNK